MPPVAFFDTKPYDRQFFDPLGPPAGIEWRFFEWRLNRETAAGAAGCPTVCIFVNDEADAATLTRLREAGVRHLALRCAGYNNVDMGAARELGLAVSRAPSYSPHSTAEHAVALFLALNRRIHRAYSRVRELNFSLQGLLGTVVCGKTVGILGAGKIGRITAQIYRGFSATVLACDAAPDPDWAARHDVRYVSASELFAASDVISLHAPLLPETHHIVNRESLAQLRPGAFLVNTSRGKLIDTRAMIDALKSGRLGGVALDVYEEEEGVFLEDLSGQVLHDDELARLLTFPNVLITAHQAYFTHEALHEIARVTTENVRRFAAGQPLLDGTAL